MACWFFLWFHVHPQQQVVEARVVAEGVSERPYSEPDLSRMLVKALVSPFDGLRTPSEKWPTSARSWQERKLTQVDGDTGVSHWRLWMPTSSHCPRGTIRHMAKNPELERRNPMGICKERDPRGRVRFVVSKNWPHGSGRLRKYAPNHKAAQRRLREGGNHNWLSRSPALSYHKMANVWCGCENR